MRKFSIPNRRSKRAYPKAVYLGETVRVHGIARLDDYKHVYYRVKPVSNRAAKLKAVRCDKLMAI